MLQSAICMQCVVIQMVRFVSLKYIACMMFLVIVNLI